MVPPTRTGTIDYFRRPKGGSPGGNESVADYTTDFYRRPARVTSEVDRISHAPGRNRERGLDKAGAKTLRVAARRPCREERVFGYIGSQGSRPSPGTNTAGMGRAQNKYPAVRELYYDPSAL